MKQRQAADELTRLQDALTKVVNEAGARTRQEVPTHSTCLLTYVLIVFDKLCTCLTSWQLSLLLRFCISHTHTHPYV